MKTKLSIILLLFAFVASANNNNRYVPGKVYNVNGSRFTFLSYDDDLPMFEGFKGILPKYKGVKKSITKRNKKAIKRTKQIRR